MMLGTSVSASAQSPSLPASMQHRGYVEVSTGIGTGNIESEKVAVKGKLISTTGPYQNELKGKYSSIEGDNGGDHTQIRIADKLKYRLSGNDYVFGDADYTRNRASGITSRTTGVAGYGKNLITKDNFNFAGEAGLGLRNNDYVGGFLDQNTAVAKVGANIDWKLMDNLSFNSENYVVLEEDSTQAVSDNSLKTYVYENMYVKGSFEVEDNSGLPAAYDNTDTITSIGLGYQFN